MFNLADYRDVDSVEIKIDKNHKIWININGQCVLRVNKTKELVIEDDGLLYSRKSYRVDSDDFSYDLDEWENEGGR